VTASGIRSSPEMMSNVEDMFVHANQPLFLEEISKH
jgi:hypothetical protein